jgi:hypothetical protein
MIAMILFPVMIFVMCCMGIWHSIDINRLEKKVASLEAGLSRLELEGFYKNPPTGSVTNFNCNDETIEEMIKHKI